MKNRIIDTDVLIIGGGTAGCFAGITLGKKKDLDVLIVEKANIVRRRFVAAGAARRPVGLCGSQQGGGNPPFAGAAVR